MDVEAIKWAISLLEIHEGIKVNPNSQYWLDRLRAAVDGLAPALEREPPIEFVDIQNIEQRLAAITPGPWRAIPPDANTDKWFVARRPFTGDVPPEKHYVAVFGLTETKARDAADATFIADAPKMVAALLASTRGLRAALTTLLGAVREVREQNFIAVGAMIPPTFRPVLLSALEALAAAEQAARQSIEAP